MTDRRTHGVRIGLATLFVLLIAPLFAQQAAESAKPARKPNVIVLMTDDQGYGDLSVTGNPVLKTPNINRLAREGVQLTNFHVDS